MQELCTQEKNGNPRRLAQVSLPGGYRRQACSLPAELRSLEHPINGLEPLLGVTDASTELLHNLTSPVDEERLLEQMLEMMPRR